jgi:hypothetical protein
MFLADFLEVFLPHLTAAFLGTRTALYLHNLCFYKVNGKWSLAQI